MLQVGSAGSKGSKLEKPHKIQPTLVQIPVALNGISIEHQEDASGSFNLVLQLEYSFADHGNGAVTIDNCKGAESEQNEM
jgi:hypothetical protein